MGCSPHPEKDRYEYVETFARVGSTLWARQARTVIVAPAFRFISMTKSEETRLTNLSRKQGFETLDPSELKQLNSLAARKGIELEESRREAPHRSALKGGGTGVEGEVGRAGRRMK